MVIVPSYCVSDSDCYFLVCTRLSLIFLGVLCMVPVISWRAPDRHCCFLVRFGWSMLFPGRCGWSLLFVDALWKVIVMSKCALDGHYYFQVCSGWSLFFPGAFWIVIVIVFPCRVHKQDVSHRSKHKAKH